ncbi:MAG: phosphotransferase [Candidatus Parcubacteria bacterium]|nr:phosphotransferase [Candidatus Parcubacteria bacterium]
MPHDFPKEIINEIERLLNIKVIKIDTPPQGMDCVVVFIKDDKNTEYAVKYGKNAANDALVYKLLRDHQINIPVPKIYGVFEFDGNTVLILERIKYPLLETIPVDKMYKYIPSMVTNLRKIHLAKSDEVGSLIEAKKMKDWKTLILSKFNGENKDLDWQKIAARPSLDKKLVLQSVANVISNINKTEFINHSYSLLHTDFNQRNLFVNPNTDAITGIIDWGEAIFGDPIFDFARVRMYIWHFNLQNDILNKYYNILSFAPFEKKLEKLYWVTIVIEYLAYYSEEMTEFNIGRIKLHQDFLRAFVWED